MTTGWRISVAAIVLSLAAPSYADRSAETTLEVLHWWTSASEHAAAELLREAMEEEGYRITDYAIVGGAGEGAVKVLKARVLLDDAPDIAQIIGPSIRNWAELGFFHSLAGSQDNHTLFDNLSSPVFDLVAYEEQPFAVPLAIHRVNTLIFNQTLFDKFGLEPAVDWASWLEQLDLLQQAGIVPLAHSNQPWQNATLFETVLAVTASPDTYHQIMIEQDSSALLGEEMALSLTRFRQLKSYMQPLRNSDWSEATRQVFEGKAGMQLMGDWALGEVLQWQTGGLVGSQIDNQIGCSAFFSQQHLYSVDSLVFFRSGSLTEGAVQRLVQKLGDSDFQYRFAQVKGAIPARQDAALSVQPCLAASARDFEQQTRLPSLVHRTAAIEEVRNVFIHALHRFFNDDTQDIKLTQTRLAAELRALQ